VSDRPHAPTAAPTAVAEWSAILDRLDATATARGADDDTEAGMTPLPGGPASDGLPVLPPELEARARAVLARLAEASAEVGRQMGELRAEMTAPRTARGWSDQPRSSTLDLHA
jgi:hypothetical protein